MSEQKQSIFDTPEFQHLKGAWSERVKTLNRRQAYYDGSIYNKFRRFLPQEVYREIKPLYLPLSRAVDVDAGIIPGGWEFPEDAPETWAEGRKALFNMSRWNVRGVLLVHYGAQGGLSCLRVSDLQDENKVIISPVDPATVMVLQNGPFSEPHMALVVEDRADAEGQYEYAEVITPETIRTFRNGTPFAYDADNGRTEEYKNTQGAVPIVEGKHMETGTALSEATFEKAIPILDEVNQMATWLAKTIKNNADPQWAGFGIEPSEMERSSEVMWFADNPDARVEAITPQLIINQALDFVKEIAQNAKDALPELAFDELRDKTQIATATLEIQLMELVLKIQRCRPNYDDVLVRAMQLAGRAAKTMSNSEAVRPIQALDDPDLTLDDERGVLPLDPITRLDLEIRQMERDMLEAAGRMPADTEGEA